MDKKYMRKCIEESLLLSTGCTEPISLCYLGAVTRKYLGEEAKEARIYVSRNIVKNAMDAGIPHSAYKGAAFAFSLGLLFAREEDGFRLLEKVDPSCHREAHIFAKEKIALHLAENVPAFFAKAVAKGANHTAEVVLSSGHTNITRVLLDGKVILQKEEKQEEERKQVDFSLEDIFAYIAEETDFSFAKEMLETNISLEKEGEKVSCGKDAGKITPFLESAKIYSVAKKVASAVDARMSGMPNAAMACTGSGNQGITLSLATYYAAKELGKEEEAEKAVTLAILFAVYIKGHLNVLSYLCGAVVASSAASSAICYLLGGGKEQITRAAALQLATLGGMFCDGAKGTCACKVLSCVTTAISSAYIAMQEKDKAKEGMLRETLEDTVSFLSKLEKQTAESMDKAILDLLMT